MIRALAVATLLLAASPALAQSEDEQLWLQVNTNVPVAPRVRVTLEQIGRFGDRAGGLTQTEFGTLLGWRATRRLEIGFGYRKVGLHNSSAANEDRLRQQLVWSPGHWVTRLRVDERFHPSGDGIGVRVRPLVRYNHPLGRGWGVFASHESFLLPNSTRWGQRSGYERMRNLAGVTVPLGRQASVDAGYLNQYRFERGSSRAQMDHALSLQLTINLATAVHAPKVDD